MPGLSFTVLSSEDSASDRTKCIANLSTLEKLIITHSNLYKIEPGQPIAVDVLLVGEYLKKLPVCPAGGKYSYTGKSPTGKRGTKAYASCSHKGHDFDPYPQGKQ